MDTELNDPIIVHLEYQHKFLKRRSNNGSSKKFQPEIFTNN